MPKRHPASTIVRSQMAMARRWMLPIVVLSGFSGLVLEVIWVRLATLTLGITIHAGEAGRAANVREAVEVLHAQRIGHGISAIEDSSVVQLLRQHSVTLEVCPTSNLQTGAIDNFGLHPLRDLYVLGVNVTINTDDPSISDTTLTDEYMVAVLGLGVSLPDLRQCLRNSIHAAFLPLAERQRLEQLILSEFDAIV